MLLSNKKTCDPSQADIITMIDDSKLRNSSFFEVSDLSAHIRRLHSSATAGIFTRFLRSFLLYDSIATVDQIVKSVQMRLKQNKTPVTSFSFTMQRKIVNLFSQIIPHQSYSSKFHMDKEEMYVITCYGNGVPLHLIDQSLFHLLISPRRIKRP